MPPRGSYPTRFPHNTINALNRLNHRDCFVIACFSSCKRTTYAARRKIRDENNRKTKSATILGSLKILSSFFFLYFSNKKRIYTYNTIFPVYRTRVKSKSETLTFPLSLFTRLSLRHDSARRARLTSSATPLDTQLVRTDSYYPGIPSPRSHNENVCAQRIVRLVDNKLSNAARRPTLIALSRRVA